MTGSTVYTLRHHVRFVTATALFDGHDASINLIRRLLQRAGAEVVHLGHNRSVAEIVEAAIQEDAQAVAVSSYQGGHIEFFRYLVDRLRERDAPHIKIFGGGGGVIVPAEIRELEAYGVTKIFSPEDGRRLGLHGMINQMLEQADFPLPPASTDGDLSRLGPRSAGLIARLITQAEGQRTGCASPDARDGFSPAVQEFLERRAAGCRAPVVGVTGTGGAGKSSLTDELLRRLLQDFPQLSVGILSVDPSQRRTGGALLGDRIRLNAIHSPRVYMRSLAMRCAEAGLPEALQPAIQVLQAAGFDMIFVETSGIGQGDAAVTAISDVSLYVMTPDYGAASQLEKIAMLDEADLVAVNKFDRWGGEDAMRAVRAQVRRNKEVPRDVPDARLPVFGTIASQFGDVGVTALYLALLGGLEHRIGSPLRSSLQVPDGAVAGERHPLLPATRSRYLGEIAETARAERARVDRQAAIARRLYQLDGAARECEEPALREALHRRFEALREELDPECWELIRTWGKLRQEYDGETYTFEVRGRPVTARTAIRTLSGTRVPKVALPRSEDWGEILRFRLDENVPGSYPFTAGVYPFKRSEEEPRRQFAGEGGPRRTNQRFHYLCGSDKAKRLSTAFDSVTLYGEDPDERPDIYGRIGEGGVSVATLDDMRTLYAGFDLTDPLTSVSMTINGPAPAILAMFFNVAIDREAEKFERAHGRAPDGEERERIVQATLRAIRGTVQADILKEDQAQNECIFSTEFSLRVMGDVQRYFINRQIRNFYSVSVSGYHIAEAGANPITQLAFTLANGFTYVEYYLARGMRIDDFARHLSFFFSNGLDPEYSVLGRVARRIWARVLKTRYGANERSQKFKYHIQTSGRSLYAMAMEFNDIRTTLQALTATYDHCNSLHTNAYDEAITTPTAESVRRAMAIQQIIDHEFGMTKNENPLQGSYIISELTDLVEEAVLAEFDRLNERGGVLEAMELQYQRSRIQEESLLYELKKDSGELPVIGVNTFREPEAPEGRPSETVTLSRAAPEEKREQVENVRAFQQRHQADAPEALGRLKRAAQVGDNIFAELMRSVRAASLGQITHALYEVGGQYRRAM